MDAVSSNPAQDVAVCGRCGSAMPKSALFCPQCGRSAKPLDTTERTAGTVAYLTLVPAVVLLFLPAFRRDRFVRFHAWQSILLWGAFLMVSVISILLSNLAAVVVFLLVGILASLAMFFLWAVLSFKAWQGECFELPLIGPIAERLS